MTRSGRSLAHCQREEETREAPEVKITPLHHKHCKNQKRKRKKRRSKGCSLQYNTYNFSYCLAKEEEFSSLQTNFLSKGHLGSHVSLLFLFNSNNEISKYLIGRILANCRSSNASYFLLCSTSLQREKKERRGLLLQLIKRKEKRIKDV